jgi:hypothetical protein
MSGTPDAEDRLRSRLREVDDLEPPDQGFELRALRAGRDRLKRRQSWTRGLVGAAAAVVVGALAVPTIGRMSAPEHATSGASSAGSAVAAPQAPEAGGSGDRDSAAAGPDVENVETVLVGLRPVLAKSYPEAFTAVTVDSGQTPLAVVLHMTAPTPAAEKTVRAALPPAVDVVTEPSAFSAAQCQATLARVTADRSNLTTQGYAVGSLTCEPDGRVAVEVTNLVTAEQIQALTVRYGDGVTVVQAVATPTP